MLDPLIPKLRFQLAKASKLLPEDGVAVVEKVYNDILLMRNFIVNEFQRIEDDKSLGERDKNSAKREVLEKTITKLEILKSKRSTTDLINELESKLSEVPASGDDRILKFLQEREIRDRLATMTPSQILSHFENSLLDGSNPLLLDAILNTPPGFEVLPVAVVRLHRKAAFPDEIARVLSSLRCLLLIDVRRQNTKLMRSPRFAHQLVEFFFRDLFGSFAD